MASIMHHLDAILITNCTTYVVLSSGYHAPWAKGSLVNLVNFLGPKALNQPECVLANQIVVYSIRWIFVVTRCVFVVVDNATETVSS